LLLNQPAKAVRYFGMAGDGRAAAVIRVTVYIVFLAVPMDNAAGGG
jgi:hypothetical protein